MSTAKILWANDLSGIARHILEVPSGLDCNCICPGCAARLEAVNSQNPHWKKRPHFRHYEAPELDDCAEKAVFAAARAVVQTITEIKLPGFEVTKTAVAPSGKVFTGHGRSPEQITSVEAAEFIDFTDAILTLSGGQKIRLRLIAKTTRSADPNQPVMGEIEIDLKNPLLHEADPESLRKYISLDGSARRWCHYANMAAIEKIALDDANFQLQDYVVRTAIPPPSVADQVQSSRPVVQTFLKQHVTIKDMDASIKALRGRHKRLHCQWATSHPDTSSWAKLIPTWEAIFNQLYGDILDAGMTARELNLDPSETLSNTADDFGFTPHAVISLWVAAGIARR